jgi:hypothetical protein
MLELNGASQGMMLKDMAIGHEKNFVCLAQSSSSFKYFVQ